MADGKFWVSCSVYYRRLQAVPISPGISSQQVCLWGHGLVLFRFAILHVWHFNLAGNDWFGSFLMLSFRFQNVPRNDFEKQRILQRIEPWIRREIEAILGDPDTSIILHVVSSLFFSRREGKYDGSSGQLGVEDAFLAPLKPFLQDRTNMFWHELR